MTPLVVHLTVVHRADDVRILVKECASLAQAGYEVMLVAPGSIPRETYGVHVHVLPSPSGRLARLLRTQWQLFRATRRLPAATFHFHDPELFLSAWLLSRRAPVIYDVHENFAAQLRHRPWLPAVLRPAVARAFRSLERVFARRWRGVVAATESIAQQFGGHERVAIVRNYPRLEEFAQPRERARERIVAYVGDLTPIRGAREMVDAIHRTSGAVLEMAGRFSPAELEMELRSEPGWTHVRWRGWLGRDDIAELLGRAAAGLVVLHPVPNYFDALPVKLFEYMAAGVPVVASDFPSWRSIVAEPGAGLLVDPLDTGAIAEAIDWLLAHPEQAVEMGQRGARAVRQRFHWAHEEATLLALYQRVHDGS